MLFRSQGLSGKLAAGDIVSVIAPDYKKQGSTVIPPELTYVEVIGVTASSGNDTDQTKTESSKSDSKDAEKQLPATVTLLATSDQAKILAELESEGSIHLSLVYRGSKDKADEFLATQDKLLSALYPKTTSSSSGTASGSNSVPSGTNVPAVSSAAPESEGK